MRRGRAVREGGQLVLTPIPGFLIARPSIVQGEKALKHELCARVELRIVEGLSKSDEHRLKGLVALRKREEVSYESEELVHIRSIKLLGAKDSVDVADKEGRAFPGVDLKICCLSFILLADPPVRPDELLQFLLEDGAKGRGDVDERRVGEQVDEDLP